MNNQHSSLTAALQKARELRITDGFGLFILTKAPHIHDYRLINTADPQQFRLWFQNRTHDFACIIDVLDIITIDSTLPVAQLHQLFTDCELLTTNQRTCLDLADFLQLLIDRKNAETSTVHN